MALARFQRAGIGACAAVAITAADIGAPLADGRTGAPVETLLSDDEHDAWRAIGRVNVGGYRSRSTCTGTLIAADLVLTAAHCVPTSALREDHPQTVHFVAGWLRDGYAAHRTVARIDLHPAYQRAALQEPHMPAADLALLTLETPISAETVSPLPLGRIADDGTGLSVIAYSNARPGALSRRTPCAATPVLPYLLGLDCAAQSGNSGGPVLEKLDGGWRLVAVMVAHIPGGEGPRSLAAVPGPALFEAADRTEIGFE